MKRAYSTLLRLYPRDYRAMFAREMQNAFETTAEDRRANGRVVFIAVELIGLVRGAVSEWIAKLTTDRSTRGRSLPDLLLMRPPGVSWEAHYAGTFEDDQPCSPDT
jgi:hypothetical protein